jgi:MYXO-CTERM domain-containing protein
MRLLLSVPLAALLFALPRAAHAEPTYPGALQSALGLSYVPACVTCHVGVPGPTTSVQPFSLAMQMRGLGGGANTVAPAAMKMATDMVDSDGNGTDDVDQLKQGCNPNDDTPETSGATCGSSSGTGGSTGSGGNDIAPVTAYGCGAQLAPGPASWQGALALAAAAALAFGRRRRRP